jgi:hypothetical protein
VRLAVRLTPRASRNGIDGIVDAADGRKLLQLRLARGVSRTARRTPFAVTA